MLQDHKHLHLLGASGSGTTTLAAQLAREFGLLHLDTDDFFWEKTDPPYTTIRPQEERLAMLRGALQAHPRWVLSGSLCGWGDELIPEFDLVVFLYVPPQERLVRLKAREIGRYGEEAIAAGGPLHEAHQKFMDWTAQYDTAEANMRSLKLHQNWLGQITVPVVEVPGNLPYAEQLALLQAAL